MIEKMPFGKTGHASTRTIFGAAALWGGDVAAAERALKIVLERGINHIDTAASYGRSERLVGSWFPEHREKFFLATKTDKRTKMNPRAQFRAFPRTHARRRASTCCSSTISSTPTNGRRRWAPVARSKRPWRPVSVARRGSSA